MSVYLLVNLFISNVYQQVEREVLKPVSHQIVTVV
jgi:hypothetical protein